MTNFRKEYPFMRKILFGLILILGFAPHAFASNVSVNVNIGTPPPVYVTPPVAIDAPPLFLQPPQLGFYVAAGVGYDLFRFGNAYYLNSGNMWYSSPHYNGPWINVHYNKIPHGLRKYPIKRIHYYRDMHYRQYKAGKGVYKYKHYRPKHRKHSGPGYTSGNIGKKHGVQGKYNRDASFRKGGYDGKGTKNKPNGGGHHHGPR